MGRPQLPAPSVHKGPLSFVEKRDGRTHVNFTTCLYRTILHRFGMEMGWMHWGERAKWNEYPCLAPLTFCFCPAIISTLLCAKQSLTASINRAFILRANWERPRRGFSTCVCPAFYNYSGVPLELTGIYSRIFRIGRQLKIHHEKWECKENVLRVAFPENQKISFAIVGNFREF